MPTMKQWITEAILVFATDIILFTVVQYIACIIRTLFIFVD